MQPFDISDEHDEKVLVWRYFGYACDGRFVEVGANAPGISSQTWLLERVGWSGVLVEPLPDKIAMNRAQRPAAYLFAGVATSPEKVGEVTLYVGEQDGNSTTQKNLDDHDILYTTELRVRAETLDAIVESAACSRIDFLAVDTEGTEIDVLRGLNLERWRPRLILIEDKLINLSKHRFLRQAGYKLVKRTSLNNWYVPETDRFSMTSLLERLKLVRKVFFGLPFRKLRHWRHH